MKQGTLQKFFVNKTAGGGEYLKLFLLAADGQVEKATIFDQWYFELGTDHDIRQFEGKPVEYETTTVQKGDATYINVVRIQPSGLAWEKPAKQDTPPPAGAPDFMAAASLIAETLAAQLGAINESLYEIAMILKSRPE